MTARILQVVSHLGHRAAGQQIVALARGLPRDQFDLNVCAIDCCEAERQSIEQLGIPVSLLRERAQHTSIRWSLPRRLGRFIQHVRRLNPDVIHFFSEDTAGTSLAIAAARVATRSRGCEVVSTQWNEHRASRCLERLGIRQGVPRIGPVATCGTSSSPDFEPETGSVDFTFPIGIDAASLSDGTDKHLLLQKAGLPSDAKLIVAYSDYSTVSRFKDAIWTADLLKVIRDDTHLVLIGDGPLHWRGDRFRNQVSICDRVHLVTDCCQWQSWIPSADCYWDVDGLRQSVLFAAAAMMHGVPVIAADTQASRSLLGDDGALFFAPGHRGGLARNCQQLLSDNLLATRLAETGRSRAERLLSWDQMVEGYCEVYGNLVDPS